MTFMGKYCFRRDLKSILFQIRWKVLQCGYAVWDRRPWRGSYTTPAEQMIIPHIKDMKILFFLGWTFLVFSLVGEIYAEKWFSEAFQRAGAVLSACGVLIGMKIQKINVVISLIKQGQMSVDGQIGSADLPGAFGPQWSNAQINAVPALAWLGARRNDVIKFGSRAAWAVILGTAVWAYGDLLV